MDADNTIERCHEVTSRDAARSSSPSSTGRASQLEGMLLKPNMVISGKELPDPGDVGRRSPS